jgi:hypothetical protein
MEPSEGNENTFKNSLSSTEIFASKLGTTKAVEAAVKANLLSFLRLL